MWFMALDVMEPYFHIDVHPSRRRFLQFIISQEHFQFWNFPFILMTAPRVFTKFSLWWQLRWLCNHGVLFWQRKVIIVQEAYCLGIHSSLADKLSMHFLADNKSEIHDSILTDIFMCWSMPLWNIFASQTNKKLPPYCFRAALGYDPQSDAFLWT